MGVLISERKNKMYIVEFILGCLHYYNQVFK